MSEVRRSRVIIALPGMTYAVEDPPQDRHGKGETPQVKGQLVDEVIQSDRIRFFSGNGVSP